MSNIKDRIDQIAVDDKGSWVENARYRRTNRDWLRKSARIAVRVLLTIKKRGIEQQELAKMLDVTPQMVSKIVKGKQNMTLETISKLERTLGITLFEIPDYHIETDVKEIRGKANLQHGQKKVAHHTYSAEELSGEESWSTTKNYKLSA